LDFVGVARRAAKAPAGRFSPAVFVSRRAVEPV